MLLREQGKKIRFLLLYLSSCPCYISIHISWPGIIGQEVWTNLPNRVRNKEIVVIPTQYSRLKKKVCLSLEYSLTTASCVVIFKLLIEVCFVFPSSIFLPFVQSSQIAKCLLKVTTISDHIQLKYKKEKHIKRKKHTFTVDFNLTIVQTVQIVIKPRSLHAFIYQYNVYCRPFLKIRE